MSTHELAIGPKVLIEGASGTGKTYAIGTAVDWAARNNKRVCVLFVENGLETLTGYWTDRGLSIPDNLYWHNCLTKPLSLTSLIDSAKDIGMLSYEMLTKKSDPNRAKNNAFEDILRVCADFKDDRTGKTLGAVDSWGLDTLFVIDSLSELCNAAVKMVIGNKIAMAPPEYGTAQNAVMNFLRLLTQGCAAPVLMTAHVSRETDEITGGVKLMTSAIGKAIAGDIPKLFSDVIYTVREGDKFYWDTAAGNVDTKTRNLPIQGKQVPDFGRIMDKWVSRGGR